MASAASTTAGCLLSGRGTTVSAGAERPGTLCAFACAVARMRLTRVGEPGCGIVCAAGSAAIPSSAFCPGSLLVQARMACTRGVMCGSCWRRLRDFACMGRCAGAGMDCVAAAPAAGGLPCVSNVMTGLHTVRVLRLKALENRTTAAELLSVPFGFRMHAPMETVTRMRRRSGLRPLLSHREENGIIGEECTEDCRHTTDIGSVCALGTAQGSVHDHGCSRPFCMLSPMLVLFPKAVVNKLPSCSHETCLHKDMSLQLSGQFPVHDGTEFLTAQKTWHAAWQWL